MPYSQVNISLACQLLEDPNLFLEHGQAGTTDLASAAKPFCCYIDTSTLALVGGLRLSTMPLLFEKNPKRCWS